MQNLYKTLLKEVLLLEATLVRPQRKRKNPFRWIIVDSYSKSHGNGIYNRITTRLWE